MQWRHNMLRAIEGFAWGASYFRTQFPMRGCKPLKVFVVSSGHHIDSNAVHIFDPSRRTPLWAMGLP